jgi:Kef-type K+ transport system membrane component KefB
MLSDHPVLVVMAVAVVAPLLAEIPLGLRVPVVVLEVLLGIVIGPQLLGLIEPGAFLSKMQIVGTSAVLFMAGMEIDFGHIRGRALSLGIRGWVASVALGFAAVGLLRVIPDVHAPMMVAIALTTTMLGALIPILRDGGNLDGPFGRMMLAAGTVGEVGPIIAVSLVLSDRYTSWQELGLLVVFLTLVGVAMAVGMGARPPRVLALLSQAMHASTQLPVRLALLVMAALLFVAVEFGFEGVLGAFAAGMIVGLATRGEGGKVFRLKIDAVCFGWLTPFFFVATGIQFDLGALTRDLETMLLTPAFLLLFLVVRGVPVFLYRDVIPKAERLPFALYSSVASLALVVVITQIGLHAKHMSQDVAQALIAAALLSLLVYPTLAGVLSPKATPPVSRGASG